MKTFAAYFLLLIGIFVFFRTANTPEVSPDSFHYAGLPLFSFLFKLFAAQPLKKPLHRKAKSHEINSATYQKIMQNIAQFEEEKGFLEEHLTLYSLANRFNCNTKYLSLVIKKSKNKNFSKYINDLRIAYIIRKMSASKKYCNYKISHLTKLSGFGSHTAFYAAFLAYTGEKPSTFIKKQRDQWENPNENS